MKRIVSGIMLTLLLTGMLVLAFNVQPVKSAIKTIIVPDDYPTIQEAINHASDGNTIFVRNGTYVETVGVEKSVSLIGESKRGTIVDGNYRTAFNVAADTVSIGNMGTTGEYVSICLRSSENIVNGNEIHGAGIGISLLLKAIGDITRAWC